MAMAKIQRWSTEVREFCLGRVADHATAATALMSRVPGGRGCVDDEAIWNLDTAIMLRRVAKGLDPYAAQ